MKAVVAERGRVTIPKRLRERLGIRPGTVLEFREANKLVAEKTEMAGALDRWYGSLGRRRTDDLIRSLRGEPSSRRWIRALSSMFLSPTRTMDLLLDRRFGGACAKDPWWPVMWCGPR